ncbi:hypothetical protein IU421_14835 [Nocardia cyriacigeorgica]|uniref:hypothetical protein n=1 Tax=Nocardia cyriacigeorgica TaxID=135487 RepID=UPI001893C238|nr:hypothetical protein [Nocardia cyriacigeorgica]MBF6515546.1 hypothetical protein [Nocardia cyriacigeorgica]
MSVFDDIRARIAADKDRDASLIDQDTLEGARADIVGQILDIAEDWMDKAEGWSWEEQYCNQRNGVCLVILEILNEHLWDEEGSQA